MNIDWVRIIQWADSIKAQFLAGFTILFLFAAGYIVGRLEQTLQIHRDLKRKVPTVYKNKLESMEQTIATQAARIDELEQERISLITYVNYLMSNIKRKQK